MKKNICEWGKNYTINSEQCNYGKKVTQQEEKRKNSLVTDSVSLNGEMIKVFSCFLLFPFFLSSWFMSTQQSWLDFFFCYIIDESIPFFSLIFHTYTSNSFLLISSSSSYEQNFMMLNQEHEISLMWTRIKKSKTAKRTSSEKSFCNINDAWWCSKCVNVWVLC